ncbi:Isopentenyl-diphosphate Delta-isomerase [Sulfitobacter indolifex]|uniref:Isopentenyl-diphosphate Delta-isomerase n=1 Tax=Sulfitobacter indolifex HEL-45 TaxID=391624 RepID=A0ABM9XAK9_9RHOB|nr:isopentenyl-diphosphate Delta-isomerase [Sulfitobacter indolifex]EDQ06392.1 isopentyl-diphosphate delta-isomerase [Sulfitobacter indolifex HEL-45]UOA17384.1 Isopentenyl-diphosphate Delta-isomerase [Sulfitobacter indolifex]
MAIMVPAWVDGTLQPVEKLAAHARGLRHKAISVFVIAEGKLLLQQRALGKYHTPGLWANTCCTHPQWDEPPNACAARRLDEELGITGLDLQHRGQVEYCADVGGGLIEHEVVEVFLAHAASDLSITENRDEVMATRWISLSDLHADLAQNPEDFTPWLRIYMAEHEGLILGDGAME